MTDDELARKAMEFSKKLGVLIEKFVEETEGNCQIQLIVAPEFAEADAYVVGFGCQACLLEAQVLSAQETRMTHTTGRAMFGGETIQ